MKNIKAKQTITLSVKGESVLNIDQDTQGVMYESNDLLTHVKVFWITSNGLIFCYLSLAELDDLIEEIKKN